MIQIADVIETTDEKKYGDNCKAINKEFCILWKCRKYTQEVACFYCPIIKDISIMYKELFN